MKNKNHKWWMIFPIFLGFTLFTLSCDEDLLPSPPNDELEALVLDILFYADLMPVVEPDPIICFLTVQLTNLNEIESFIDFKIPSARVYNDSTGMFLGEIRFTTDWNGFLEPSEIDTVNLRKIKEEIEIFSPPCSELVYLDINLVNSENEIMVLKTDSFKIGCFY